MPGLPLFACEKCINDGEGIFVGDISGKFGAWGLKDDRRVGVDDQPGVTCHYFS